MFTTGTRIERIYDTTISTRDVCCEQASAKAYASAIRDVTRDTCYEQTFAR